MEHRIADPAFHVTLHEAVGTVLYRLRAFDGELEVGRLSATIEPGHVMLLGEVRVFNKVITRRNVLYRLARKFSPKLGTSDYRRRGIGTVLLRTFLVWCRSHRVQEVYGSIVQQSLDDNPGLLSWYERHEFTVRPPDPRALGNAIHLVVWPG